VAAEKPKTKNYIDFYAFGRMRIDGVDYGKDLIVLPGGRRKLWWRQESHKVGIKDARQIIAEEPEVVVIGTGASGFMKVLPEVENFLKNRGIKLIILPTARAVEEFNKIVSKGKFKIVGAFHLTC